MAIFAIVAVVAVVAASFVVYPSFATVEDAEVQSKHVTVKARGWAFQRIDEETIKQGPVEFELDIELRWRKGPIVGIPNVSGSVNVSGTIYSVESGKGLLHLRKHVALIRCNCSDEEGNEVTLGIYMAYFWWGGNAYALRIKALMKTENPMLLMMRGVAKVE